MPDSIPNEPSVHREDDRRLWPRGPGVVAEVLLRDKGGNTCPAAVLDESLTGLAIVLDDTLRLARGEEVQVRYEDVWSFALVRHVKHSGRNTCQVGLEWGCSESRFAGLAAVIESFCDKLAARGEGLGAGGTPFSAGPEP